MIEHVAIICRDIEKLKDFYVKYFEAAAQPCGGPGHRMYFLSFPDGGSRLELMERADPAACPGRDEIQGFVHLAFLARSKAEVRGKTARLEADGYTVVIQPRDYGPAFYESAFLDPEGNYLELSVGPDFLDVD